MSRNTDKPSGFRSPLGAYAPQMREADPTLGRQACKEVWHAHALAVFNPKHLTPIEEIRVRQLADEIYGKRREDAR